MPASILVTHSYFLRLDPKQWETAQPYPPLATLQAASVLREAGFNVSFFDTQFCRQAGEIEPILQQLKPDLLVIYDDGFNYLTKMCLTNMREAAFEMIALAHKYNCRIIISSSDSTDRYEHYLEKGADYVLLGEAEQTLKEVCGALFNPDSNEWQIPGLAFMQSGAVVKTPKRPVLTQLDSLPMPAWDLLTIDPYRNMWVNHHGYFSLNMSTTRGCPFKCNWCAKPIYGNRYNSRSPKHVVHELQYLKQLFGFDHIWFCDDIFGLKPGWVDAFANEVYKHGLKFGFKIQSRADLLVQENYVASLKKAGCQTIWMGAESGSQKILDAMDKGITVEQIYKATSLIRNQGMRPAFFIQFGYPGETRNDIKLTIKLIETLLPDEMGISVSYPLPGTPFYEKVKSQLQVKTNWTDSDELVLMFRNSYPPAFYKQLHRHVHFRYRIKKAWAALFPAKGMRRTELKKILSLPFLIPALIFSTIKLNRLART